MSALTWFRLLSLGVALSLLALGPARTQEGKGKKYALLVGITEYDHSNLTTLKYTEHDVEELAETLTSKGGFTSVQVLTNTRGKKDAKAKPTKANIVKALDALFAGVNRDDTVLIALAGHGVRLEVNDRTEKLPSRTYSYFCPLDAHFRDVSHGTGNAPGLILMPALMKDLAGCGAGTKLLLVDACRDDHKAESSTRSFDSGEMALPRGMAALFSCKPGERAWETKKLGKNGHGVFFHYVIEGLKGRAANRDGNITWSALAEYVNASVTKEVPKLFKDGASQTPHGAQNFFGTSPVLAKGKPGEEPAPRPGASGEKFSNSLGMELVRIKPGKFTMGSPPEQRKKFIDAIGSAATRRAFAGWVTQETEHEVEITRPFHVGVYEVTQKQFRSLMSGNPSYFGREGKRKDEVKNVSDDDLDGFPVESVTWENAQEFCKKLSKAEGRTYRLPTEAEWEYCCRAGTTTAFHTGDRITTKQANYGFLVGDRESLGRPAKVGYSEPNAWGLHDMHGNVHEWCSDWHARDYYQKGQKDPAGPSSGTRRVMRGGAWNTQERYCRSAHRHWLAPATKQNNVGFRVVCEVAE